MHNEAVTKNVNLTCVNQVSCPHVKTRVPNQSKETRNSGLFVIKNIMEFGRHSGFKGQKQLDEVHFEKIKPFYWLNVCVAFCRPQ